MIVIDYDPRDKIPPIHANDIYKKLFISLISLNSVNLYYISYGYICNTSNNRVALRGISNLDRTSVKWDDTETNNILDTIIKERSSYQAIYYVVENRQDFQMIVDMLRLKDFPIFLGELIHCANVLFGPEIP